jgi:membrane protease YdiL (CAAX protease family)
MTHAGDSDTLAGRLLQQLRRLLQPRGTGVMLGRESVIFALLAFTLPGVLLAMVFAQPSAPPGFDGIQRQLIAFLLSSLLLFGLFWRLRQPYGLEWTAIPQSLGWGLGWAVLSTPTVLLVGEFARRLLPATTLHPALELWKDADPIQSWLIVITAVVAAPLAEELFCRGVLYNAVAERFSPWTGVLASSALFALLHASRWPDPVPLFLLGVLLALAYARSASLWTPIFFHAAFNGINLALASLIPS